MAGNKIINLFPLLAFIAGAALKSLSLMFNNEISPATAALISFISLVIIMVTFSLIYLR